MATAQQAIMCDDNCQKQKKANELKQNISIAEANVVSAPAQLQTAKNVYTTYVQGTSAATTQRERELNVTANTIADTYTATFATKVREIQRLLETYESTTINLENVMELFSKYKNENIKLQKKYKIKTSDVLTNERKTYYENQGIDTLQFYYFYVLLFVYCGLVLFYIVKACYAAHVNWKARLFGAMCLITLPFLSLWILKGFMTFVTFILTILPKNVHLDVDTK
jgi:hypothetical protein